MIRKEAGNFPTSIMRGGAFTLANQGVVSVSNFLTGAIIGRGCTKAEFGLYMLGFSVVLLILELQVSLISTPYMVYCPRLKGRELRLYSGSSLLHHWALSIVVMLALTACGAALSLGFGPPGVAPVFWALDSVIVFIMLREFVRRFCFAHLSMGSALLFDIFVATMQMGGLLLLAHFGLLAANRVFLVMGSACGLVGAGWLLLNHREFLPRGGRAISDLRNNWALDRWIFMSALLWAVSMNLYPWFLTLFQGTAAAGIWGACLGVLAVVNIPMMAMQNFLGPKIANLYAEEGMPALRSFTFRSSALFFLVMSGMCSVLYLLGGPLLIFIYGDKYSGNGYVVFILALGLVAAGVAFSYSRALFALERADVDFKVNFIPLFILFSIGLWWVRTHGPLGAAYGLLLANVSASAVRCAAFAILSRPTSGAIAR